MRPGLTGMAQVHGRNALLWEEKFAYDLTYVNNTTFSGDVKIIFETVWKAFVKQDGIRVGSQHIVKRLDQERVPQKV